MAFEINVQKGEQGLAVSPTQAWRKEGWQGYDPMQPAAQAIESQIKQWGAEATAQPQQDPSQSSAITSAESPAQPSTAEPTEQA